MSTEGSEVPIPHSEGDKEKSKQSIEAEPHPDLVAKYSLLREKLNPKRDVIYHPCGANDISPSLAFPGSRVIYVDIDENAMGAVKHAGFEAHTASALEYDPGKVDMLILLNPSISPEIPSSHVVEGGYIVCNDYHNTASELRENPEYKLTAMLRMGEDQSLLFDQENLDDYWKDVETDEEFKKAPLSWGAVNYQTAVQTVEALTGKTENILAEYKKIIEQARQAKRAENERILREYKPPTKEELAAFGIEGEEYDEEAMRAQFSALLEDPDKEDIFVVNHDGRQYVLEATLPSKKGIVDDLFVFRKKETNSQSVDK